MAGIYIHIPFCKKLCHYCDFYHVVTSGEHNEFLKSLIAEAESRQNYTGPENISTIYIGGGTPSVLTNGELEMMLNALYGIFKIGTDCEITIELNPDDVTKEYTDFLKNLNINRISLGVQSFRDSDLKLLNRRHNAEQVTNALNSIFSSGFENITIDLIYGIPGLGIDAWSSNLDLALAYNIKHLSAYHLTIEPGTMFGKMKERGVLTEIDEDESTAQFNILTEKTDASGFIHYEISNFGKPGFFSRHNTNYWKQVPYIGLGPSAHSFNGFSRQWNIRDIKKYIKHISTGKPFFEKEDLDIKTRFNEYIMTSLRTMWGIDLEYIEKMFEKEGYDYVSNLSGKYISYGLMLQKENSLILTNQGKMISDNIISEFMMPGDN